MKNTKGFTLVELLAVIVIMGILMMVAIPAVSRTIENTRKDSFVNTAKNYANAALTQWTADGFSCGGITSSAVDTGKDYYIEIDSTVNSLDIIYEKESPEQTVYISGNSNFVTGENIVKVVVLSGDKTRGKTYNIHATRKPSENNSY